MKETIRVLLSEEEVDRRIKEVADQINRDYAGKEVHLICVLKGGVFFMCELAKRITVPVSLDFMSVSSYWFSASSIRRVWRQSLPSSGSLAADGQPVLSFPSV